ncbi:hypothetical protein SDC9_82094 [bioreactor metagenome]|uniref:Uncharacterized protein n=1 Tax=bioreactor metagenome TaxID=1076179 RepID=A0A644Z673_9ZZZZ
MLAIAAALYLFLFGRLYIARDTSLTKTVILDPNAVSRRTESILQLPMPDRSPLYMISKVAAEGHREFFGVTRCDPTTTMDPEGRIQIRYITYLTSAHNLQFSMKVNTKYHPVDKDGYLPYDIYITARCPGGQTHKYNMSYCASENTLGYYTFRFGFNDININLEEETVYLYIKDGNKTLLSLKLAGPQTNTSELNSYNIEYSYLKDLKKYKIYGEGKGEAK